MNEIEHNLTIIDDTLTSRWWNRIRVRDFNFFERIFDLEHAKIEDGDVLIHKEKKEGERFPTIKYHLVMGQQILLLENKKIKDHLKDKLIEFVKINQKLPYFVTYTKNFKNGNIQVDFKPSNFDNFAITIKPSDYPDYDDFDSMYQNLQHTDNPQLSGEDGCQYTIESVNFASQLYSVNEKDKIQIKNAKIIDINKRREFYQDYYRSYYVFQLSDVIIDENTIMGKRDTIIPIMNIMVSKNVFEEQTFMVGNNISCSGKFKHQKELGDVLQNIRSITIL